MPCLKVRLEKYPAFVAQMFDLQQERIWHLAESLNLLPHERLHIPARPVAAFHITAFVMLESFLHVLGVVLTVAKCIKDRVGNMLKRELSAQRHDVDVQSLGLLEDKRTVEIYAHFALRTRLAERRLPRLSYFGEDEFHGILEDFAANDLSSVYGAISECRKSGIPQNYR
jgi:hypothetical protein